MWVSHWAAMLLCGALLLNGDVDADVDDGDVDDGDGDVHGDFHIHGDETKENWDWNTEAESKSIYINC